MATAAPRRAVEPGTPRRSRGYRTRVALALVLALIAGLLSTLAPVVSPRGVQEAFAGDTVTNIGNWSLQLTASPNPAQEGDTVTWTVSVKNLRASSNARPNLYWRPTIAWSSQVGPTLSGTGACTLQPVLESGGWVARPGYDGTQYTYFRLGWLHDGPLLSDSGVDDATFVAASAELLSRVNYLHPFREGNGRTQRAFLDQIAGLSGRILSWRNVSEDEHTRAAIDSFSTATGVPFEPIMAKIIAPPRDGLSLLDDALYQAEPLTVGGGFKPTGGWATSPLLASTSHLCGAPTSTGAPCRRRGHCPYHQRRTTRS